MHAGVHDKSLYFRIGRTSLSVAPSEAFLMSRFALEAYLAIYGFMIDRPCLLVL